MENFRSIMIVLVVALVTILLRFLPFAVFSGGKKTSGYIEYLSKVLPYAIMGMLVVYCLKGVSVFRGSHGIPELLACLTVFGLHIWRKSTLLSITVGTIVYMLLVQNVFV